MMYSHWLTLDLALSPINILRLRSILTNIRPHARSLVSGFEDSRPKVLEDIEKGTLAAWKQSPKPEYREDLPATERLLNPTSLGPCSWHGCMPQQGSPPFLWADVAATASESSSGSSRQH